MGYRTRGACLRDLARKHPFDGVNLLQLEQLAVSADGDRLDLDVAVRDRRGAIVARIHSLHLQRDAGVLAVTIEEQPMPTAQTQHHLQRFWLQQVRGPDRLNRQKEHQRVQGNQITLNLEGRVLQSGEAARVLLGLPPDGTGRLVEHVHEEDRNHVLEGLYRAARAAEGKLYYRGVDANGKISTVEHSFQQRRDRLEGHLSVVSPELARFRKLADLAFVIDATAGPDTLVDPGRVADFDSMVSLVRDALEREHLEKRLHLEPAAAGVRCCVCAAEHHLAPPGVRLELRGVSLLAQELGSLLNDPGSRFRVGESSPWCAVVERVHTAGAHLSASVESGCLALTYWQETA